MEFKEWMKKNSPPVDFILSLPDEYNFMEEEAIIPIVREHWPAVRDFIAEQNRISGTKPYIFEYQLPWPRYEQFPDIYNGEEEFDKAKSDVECEFIGFIQDVPAKFDQLGLFMESIDFSYDLLDLFIWDDIQRDQIIGGVGASIWRYDPVKGDEYFRKKLSEIGYSEPIAASYTFELLAEERWDEAAVVLKSYENSTDPTIIDRLKWLQDRE